MALVMLGDRNARGWMNKTTFSELQGWDRRDAKTHFPELVKLCACDIKVSFETFEPVRQAWRRSRWLQGEMRNEGLVSEGAVSNGQGRQPGMPVLVRATQGFSDWS